MWASFFALVGVRNAVMEAAGVSTCQAEVSIVVDGCCIDPACYKGFAGLRMLGASKGLG